MNVKIVRVFTISAGVAILAIIAVVVFWPRDVKQNEIASPAPAKTRQIEPGGANAEYVVGNGMRRKTSDLQPAKPTAEPKPGRPRARRGLPDYGTLPPIPADANPQVKAVVEAIRQKNHPERLSVLASPPPFNANAYRADPAAYLSLVELGRVFQTAQPGPGVPRLRAVSPSFRAVTQGDSVWLRVVASPGAPVSFTSFDCGEFENRLTAITVEANEEGVAEARFTTTPGVINDIHILAGSPLASGQVRFLVNVAIALAKNDPRAAGPQRGQPSPTANN